MNHITEPVILTIGHSTHSIEKFLSLVEAHGVKAIADVRSAPYSRRHPQFSRDPLRQALEEHGIRYVFCGQELGARPEDPLCYDENGRVRYRRLAETSLFRSGIDLIVQESRECRIALLCAEKEPLECHRTLLVARELVARGLPVSHIHADGHLETQTEALARLPVMLKMSETDLFRSQEELIEEACTSQENRIAYVKPHMSLASEENVR